MTNEDRMRVYIECSQSPKPNYTTIARKLPFHRNAIAKAWQDITHRHPKLFFRYPWPKVKDLLQKDPFIFFSPDAYAEAKAMHDMMPDPSERDEFEKILKLQRAAINSLKNYQRVKAKSRGAKTAFP